MPHPRQHGRAKLLKLLTLTHGTICVHFLGFIPVAVLRSVLHDQGVLCHPGWVGAHKIPRLGVPLSAPVRLQVAEQVFETLSRRQDANGSVRYRTRLACQTGSSAGKSGGKKKIIWQLLKKVKTLPRSSFKFKF